MTKRVWNSQGFDFFYDRLLATDELQFGGKLGSREYQLRYRSRYKICAERFAHLVPHQPVDVLEVGGGQLALMCSNLWGDRCTVADLPGPHMDYMAKHGVTTAFWDICREESPIKHRFDFIFMSEVIEHLPIPGYLPLEKLRGLLKPGGMIICTTPNLFRIRNVILMLIGRSPFVHFEYPEPGDGIGHFLEYSRTHLIWQFQRAGFQQIECEHVQMGHSLTNPFLRPFGWLARPLYRVSRFRDNLLLVASLP